MWLKRFHKENKTSISFTAFCGSIAVMCIGALLCGNVLKGSLTPNTHKDRIVAVSDHILGDYISLSSDSTYMVSIFSYDCPHCINSMGNLLQYKKSNYVDNVIGLCLMDSTKKEDFCHFFNPDFKIIELSESDFYKISDRLPVSFFVREDSIVKTIVGELPSGYFVRNLKL